MTKKRTCLLAVALLALMATAGFAGVTTLEKVRVVEVVNPANDQEYRLMVEMDLSAIPKGAHIDFVVMELEAEVMDAMPKVLVATARGAKRAWSADSPVWLKREEVDSLAAVAGVKAGKSGPQLFSFDITELVRKWHSGKTENNGLVIAGPNMKGFVVGTLSAERAQSTARVRVYYTLLE